MHNIKGYLLFIHQMDREVEKKYSIRYFFFYSKNKIQVPCCGRKQQIPDVSTNY